MVSIVLEALWEMIFIVFSKFFSFLHIILSRVNE